MRKGCFGEGTNNDQIVSFHDQTGRQKHGPEHCLLVFLQRLAHRQEAVSGIAFLRMMDEFDNVGIAQIEVLELVLGRDNLGLLRHIGSGAVER